MALVQVWRRRYGKRAVQSYAASSSSSLSIREQVFASQIDPGGDAAVALEALTFTDFLAREMMLSNIAVDMLRNLKTGKGGTNPTRKVRAGGGSAC